MSTVLPPTAVIDRPRSGSRGPSWVPEYFRFHGIWAPGIRLFRQVSFPVKALVISAILSVPIFLLAWNYFASQAAQIGFSALERAGTAYIAPLRALHGVVLGSNAAAAATDADWKAAESEAYDALAKVQSLLGDELGTADAWTALGAARSRLAEVPPAAPERRALLDAYASALEHLSDHVVDGSNLALDPDIDTYYLMSGFLMEHIELQAHLARLRDLTADIQASGTRGPEQDRELAIARVLAHHVAESIETGLKKVAAYNAPSARRVDADAALAAVRELESALGSLSQASADLGPAAARSAELARKALALNAEVFPRALAELDGLILARIERMDQARWIVGTVSVLAMLLSAYMFYCFYHVTRGGMQEVRGHLAAMTRGDLTTSPRPWGHDEAAGLMVTLAEMQASLRSIVSHVRASSDVIVNSSAEIASGANDLSARTEQGAANLEQQAAAIEQISATVNQTAASARQAAEIAAENAAVAQRAGSVIQQVVQTMEEINVSSGKIHDIIGVIDGIAFQTNILALNAAVEAARAGEQGKGFAVVASEVRSLAQRSGEAAREIRSLITSSVERIESGSAVVQEAGRTTQSVVENAGRMSSLLTDIAVGAREQSTGVGQVGQAVQDLDRSAQQNAALVEQTTAAVMALKQHACDLSAEVSRFHLPDAAPA